MKVYAYGRVSKDTQELSEGSQRDMCEKWMDLKKSMGQDHEWAGWHFDEDVSASIPFVQRPYGEAIILKASRGDKIICSNFDRMFRSVLDFCLTFEILEEAGISLVVLDADFDTSTNIGAACMKIVAVMKELELKEIGRRTKEGLAQVMKKGGLVGSPPIGWKAVTPKRRRKGDPKRLLVPDHTERRMCKEIMNLKDNNGLGSQDVIELLYKKGIKPLRKRRGYRPDRFTASSISTMYRAAKYDFPKRPSKSHPSGSRTSQPLVRAVLGASSYRSSKTP
jgi:DNA invertase Pin-like site-specific DNA recombinase